MRGPVRHRNPFPIGPACLKPALALPLGEQRDRAVVRVLSYRWAGAGLLNFKSSSSSSNGTSRGHGLRRIFERMGRRTTPPRFWPLPEILARGTSG